MKLKLKIKCGKCSRVQWLEDNKNCENTDPCVCNENSWSITNNEDPITPTEIDNAALDLR